MRYAFVMGSNGPTDGDYTPLRYARLDAERMKACLSGERCCFVVKMPEPGTDTFEVRRQLTIVAESCTPEDTFVCYFSGHGKLEKGSLILLWDNTKLDQLLSTALPVSDILQVLKYCQARSRLLILDCCHAGEVSRMLGLKDAAPVPVQELEISPDNYYILMASDRLESARELEMLQGSFLTTNIVTALEEKSTEADKDKDGRISMQDLYQWLEDRAKIHNQLFPNISVRYPYLLGKQKGEFYLTLDRSAWVPYELDWPDGSTMVILPLRPTNSLTTWLCNLFYRSVSGLPVVCLSKYPITNEQYLRFVMDGGGKEPIGEHYISQLEETTQQVVSEQKSAGSWQGPFYPWRSEEFRDPEKPVVCISYYEARAYCDWVNALNTQAQAYTFLPPAILWDFAAFGKYPIIQPGEEFAMFNLEYPSYNWDTIFTQYQRIHHRATAPTAIDRTGARSNALGISDLLGNVWEWCGDDEPTSPYWDKIRSLVSQGSLYEPTLHLRGGGFLDDLSIERPLRTSNLYGTSARHSDLGFRTAALIPIAHLPQEMQQHLFQRWGYPPDQASRHHRT